MNQKVYIVASTSYPCPIIGVFATKELAEECKVLANKEDIAGDYEIMEFDLISSKDKNN